MRLRVCLHTLVGCCLDLSTCGGIVDDSAARPRTHFYQELKLSNYVVAYSY